MVEAEGQYAISLQLQEAKVAPIERVKTRNVQVNDSVEEVFNCCCSESILLHVARAGNSVWR